jgi:hypothetical protein
MNKMEEENVDDFFKLSYKPNPKYPSFADCIELRSNEKYGRYLVTNRDLKVGDIIAIEDFLYSCPRRDTNEDFAKHMNNVICAHCFKSKLLDLVPCDQCVLTMYCGEKCLQDDLSHLYECHLMPVFIRNSCLHASFRYFFTALSTCNDSIEELKELIEEAEKFEKPVTVFDFDFSKMSENEKKKKLIQIMYCGYRKETENFMSKSKITRDLIINVFEFYGTFIPPKFKLNQEFIIKLMIRIWEIQGKNAFSFKIMIPKKTTNFVSACEYFSGISMCPGLSLLSHSCAPNVTRFTVGKKFALFVTRNVQKGQQLFVSYG